MICTNNSRKADLVLARQYDWWLRYRAGDTYQKIADDYGKNHSTILHGVRKIYSLFEVKDKKLIDFINNYDTDKTWQ